jgi:hypothetical protein
LLNPGADADQLATFVWRHLIFLDRPRNGGLFVWRIVDDADEFRGRALEVVDAPRMPARLLRLLLFGWSLHHGDSLANQLPG